MAFRSAGGVADAMAEGETGVLVENEYDFFLQVRALLLDARRRTEMGSAAAVHAGRFTWEKAGEAFAGVVHRQLAGGMPSAPTGERVR